MSDSQDRQVVPLQTVNLENIAVRYAIIICNLFSLDGEQRAWSTSRDVIELAWA